MGTYLKTKGKQLKYYSTVTDFQGSTNTPMNKRHPIERKGKQRIAHVKR